jgi:hypothetical protein
MLRVPEGMRSIVLVLLVLCLFRSPLPAQSPEGDQMKVIELHHTDVNILVDVLNQMVEQKFLEGTQVVAIERLNSVLGMGNPSVVGEFGRLIADFDKSYQEPQKTIWKLKNVLVEDVMAIASDAVKAMDKGADQHSIELDRGVLRIKKNGEMQTVMWRNEEDDEISAFGTAEHLKLIHRLVEELDVPRKASVKMSLLSVDHGTGESVLSSIESIDGIVDKGAWHEHEGEYKGVGFAIVDSSLNKLTAHLVDQLTVKERAKAFEFPVADGFPEFDQEPPHRVPQVQVPADIYLDKKNLDFAISTFWHCSDEATLTIWQQKCVISKTDVASMIRRWQETKPYELVKIRLHERDVLILPAMMYKTGMEAPRIMIADASSARPDFLVLLQVDTGESAYNLSDAITENGK